MAEGSVYESDRLARGYAYCRPPVHAQVIALVEPRLREAGWPPRHDGREPRALDVGCGAGLSTGALSPLAGYRVGLEPVPAMLAHRQHVAPTARFVVGAAEQLPFAARTFDLLTAAGSLNYADVRRFLPDAARVLADHGVLVVYDFSSGRRLRRDDRLDRWFASFVERYPYPPGYALNVRTLGYSEAGLRLLSYDEFEVSLPMTLASYLDYALTETNVELAVSQGTSEGAIARWCRSTLEPFFPTPHGDVCFEGYFAVIGLA